MESHNTLFLLLFLTWSLVTIISNILVLHCDWLDRRFPHRMFISAVHPSAVSKYSA